MDPAWEWHVGDPVGLGNDVGAPEVPYMGYVKRPGEDEEEIEEREKKEEEQRKRNQLINKSKQISDEAWELNREGRYNDALVFINRALEYYELASAFNVKAIILENLNQFNGAALYYNEAIECDPKNETYKHNKAACLINYCYLLISPNNYNEGLKKIEATLEIFQEISDKTREDEAWNLKGNFLEGLGNIPEAFKCYKKAVEIAKDDNIMKSTYKENRDKLLKFIDTSDIKCPRCGNEVKITDNFCLRCGNRFDMEIKLIEKKEPATDYKVTRHKSKYSKYDNLNDTIIEFDED